MIPKANGKLRSLGIPCLRDKIVQEAIRMALEPIYEAEFHENSYGFRPNRSTHHAVLRCQQMLQKRFTWVIEGDVKACFDEISHKAILGCLREKVMDNKFLALIAKLLKSGVSVEGVVHPTEKGVPQGGVVSPLLSNVVLNKLDWFLHRQGRHGLESGYAWKAGRPNVRFVRYADDWCVFITRASKHYAQRLRDQIQDSVGPAMWGRTFHGEDTHHARARRIQLSWILLAVGSWMRWKTCSQGQNPKERPDQRYSKTERSNALATNPAKWCRSLGPRISGRYRMGQLLSDRT